LEFTKEIILIVFKSIHISDNVYVSGNFYIAINPNIVKNYTGKRDNEKWTDKVSLKVCYAT